MLFRALPCIKEGPIRLAIRKYSNNDYIQWLGSVGGWCGSWKGVSSWALWEITSCSRVFDRRKRWLVGALMSRFYGVKLVGGLATGLGLRLVVAGLVGFILWVGVADAGAASDVFSDLDGAGTHRSAVESLAAEGVFEGTECAPNTFCPRDAVERWAMAVWLVRILDGSDPDPVSSSQFVDVDASQWWAPFVDRLADLGVTTGCATEPARFCPHETVTRARMASFLVRAFGLPSAPPAGFADVEGGAHAANIDALAASGITSGCKTQPLRYCPNRDTTRAQMATFLVRAVDLVGLPDRWVAIEGGAEHTCGLRTDSAVVCWGANGFGQTEAPDGQYASVTAGGEHSCGLSTNNTIVCWGNNNYDQTEVPDGQYTAVAAGSDHTCGLRTDRTIECWGNNRSGQADAPSGRFSAVAAGSDHTCGLRTDRTIVCWGNNDYGRADPPYGRYTAVAVGDRHSCGLRTDHALVCWGSNWVGQTNVPDGQFAVVATGDRHSCGLRTDHTIVCWGNNRYHQTEAADGQFVAVAVGDRHSCGLRTDSTIVCWGNNDFGRTEPPDGQYTAVAAGSEYSCGLRTDRTIVCWGNNDFGRADPPDGQHTGVAAGDQHSCGLRTDRTIVCWGTNFDGRADPPDGQYAAVAAGFSHSCGLRTDNTIVCWGQNWAGQTSVPDGQYAAVAAGEPHSCGLRADDAIVCWGGTGGLVVPPDGRYSAVAVGWLHSCGLRTDNTIVCWGSNWAGQTRVPDGQYAAVAAGRSHSCGLRTDNTIVCWGANGGLADPPDGRYSAVTAGKEHTCGLRTDNTVVCWGIAPIVAAPSGVQHVNRADLADPDMCRPYSPVAGPTAGFPLPRWAAPSTGTVQVAVLFVDFPDAVAAHTTRQEADQSLAYIEKYLETASYGRLDIEFVPLHRWLRAEHNHDHYLSGAVTGAMDKEAVRLADPHFDFTGHDILMIVMPSTHFHGANATGMVYTQEGALTTTRINTALSAKPRSTPLGWGHKATHEIAHTLGLLDMYAYDTSRHELPAGEQWVSTHFGLMGLEASYPSTRQDRVYAREMLAWSRWQLGWMNPSQIRCITEPDITVTLNPIALDPGNATAMAAIPLSQSKVIVIESRRKLGYDTSRDASLATEGVLVYTVNATLGSGGLPIKLAGDTGNGRIDRYPILTVGQSVTTHGYTITVDTDNGDTHTITINTTSTTSNHLQLTITAGSNPTH